MAQVTGRVTIKINGETLRSKEGASIHLGGVKRTPVVTDQGEVHYTEKFEESAVVCTLVHLATTDIKAIQAFKDGSLLYAADSGASWVLSNAFFAEMNPLQNGEFQVTFNGSAAESLT